MLRTLIVIVLIMWVLGLLTSYTMGGFVHVLLVIGVILLVLDVMNSRKLGW